MYVIESISAMAGIVSALFVIKKNPKYLGNQLLSLGVLFLGLYAVCILIYDIVRTSLTIQIFLRVAMILIILGCCFLYFTMQVAVHSSKWMELKIRWMIPLLLIIIYAIWISVHDFIRIISLETVNTQTELLPLIILVLGVITFLIMSIRNLWKYGVKKTTGVLQKQMKITFTGLIAGLIAVVWNIISNVVEDGAIFDVFFYLTLAITMILLAYGFRQHQSK
jgi:hypothetical protein